MYIEELILDGFKSYANRTVIKGWHPSFTAITGLNGSGKSNILDALCFVLGLDNLKQIRANSLQDLVYKRGQAGINKATVTVVFNNDNKQQSPVGYQDCKQIIITRQMVIGGKNKYMINGVNAQQHTVENLFQSVQLNVNNPHFLVMQGKITKILNMKPQEIATMIEETAGTRMYEDHKEKAFQTILKKDKKLEEIHYILTETINPRLEKLKAERQASMEYYLAKDEIDKLAQLVLAFDYRKNKIQYEDLNKNLVVKKDLVQDLETALREKNEEIVSLEKRLLQLSNEKASDLKATELEKEWKETSDNLVKTKARLQLIDKQILENESRIKELQRQSEQGDDLSKDKKKRIQLLYEQAKEDYEEKKQQMLRLEELLVGLTTGMSSQTKRKGHGQVGYQKMISDEKELLIAYQAEYEKNRMQTRHLEEALEEKDLHAPELEKRKKLLTKDREALEYKLEGLKQRMGAQDSSEERLLRENRKVLESEMRDIESKVRDLPNFHYSIPSPSFQQSKVHGLVYQLFTLKSEGVEWIKALEVAAGAKLYHGVVESEQEAKALLDNGGLTRRTTLLPLNRIQSSRIPQEKLDRLHRDPRCSGKFTLAQDILDWNKKFDCIVEYVYGMSILCRDRATAAYIAYDKQYQIKCITLDGDVYDPSGTLTGGQDNSNKMGSSILSKADLARTLQEKNRELGLLIKRIADIDDQKLRQAESIDLLRHTLDLKKKQEQEQLKDWYELQQLKQEHERRLEVQSKLASKIEQCEQQVKLYESLYTDNKNNKDSASVEKQLEEIRIKIKEAESIFSKRKHDMDQFCSEESLLNIQRDQKNTELTRLASEVGNMQQERQLIQKELNVHILNFDPLDHQIKQIRNDLKSHQQEFKSLQHKKDSIVSNLKQLERDKKQAVSQVAQLVALLQPLESEIDNPPSISLDENVNEKELRELYDQKRKYLNYIESRTDFHGDANTHEKIVLLEQRQKQLHDHIQRIEEDRKKIEATIEKLNKHKRETLLKTFKHVNKNFGEIFSELLPSGFASLEPLKEDDVSLKDRYSNISENSSLETLLASSEWKGVEMKVRLGQVWKSSLQELSGGQRSLVALSLLFSLLLHKPAPLYLLDEIDAALDLSHTQRIGQLFLSGRFADYPCQFIVISLKQNLFTNAPILFKTSFQNGVSAVQCISQSQDSKTLEDKSSRKKKLEKPLLKDTVTTF